jgi:IS605 OrfB family transposase
MVWYTGAMEIQRAVTIILPDDPDLRATVHAFQSIEQEASPICFNGGKPLRAVPLQQECYHALKGRVLAQMTITALRLVAAAYASAQRRRKRTIAAEQLRKERLEAAGKVYQERAIKPLAVCAFKRPIAMFLVGPRGRDAQFRPDGTLSIWTVAGRKHLSYSVPTGLRALFDAAKEVDSITVIERNGHLYGRVALTLDAPEPRGIHPVGIDLNETNALVAVDADGREFFFTGKETKVKNKRTSQTRARIQRKQAAKKAEKRNTHSCRRLLKRLARRRSRRTHDMACVAAKQFVAWAPQDSVLVFEHLQMPEPQVGTIRGKALRRRLALWQHRAMLQAVAAKAQMGGLLLAFVNPAYTSQTCSRCGLRGMRKRHVSRTRPPVRPVAGAPLRRAPYPPRSVGCRRPARSQTSHRCA